jgi:hypothetical protein
MHAIVFRITINDQEESDRLLHQEFVPGMSQAPGFVAGYWVTTGDNKGTSVIVFESEEAVQRVMAATAPPQTDAFTLESLETGEVVAHA